MIRHVVAFRFRPETPEAVRAAVLAGLEALPSHYSDMRRFGLGTNISARDDTFSHAFSVEFDTNDQLVAYLDSEHHERFVAESFAPAIESRAIVSFEV